jgi:hypothetical protein
MTAPEQPTPEGSPTTEAIGLAALYGIKKDERRLALAIDELAAQRAAEAVARPIGSTIAHAREIYYAAIEQHARSAGKVVFPPSRVSEDGKRVTSPAEHIISAFATALATAASGPATPPPRERAPDVPCPVTGNDRCSFGYCRETPGCYLRDGNIRAAKPATTPPPGDAGEVRRAAQTVLHRFKSDIEQGYVTRDKRFAVDVLSKALEAGDSPSSQETIADHRFDGGSFGGGDQGECAVCGRDAKHHAPQPDEIATPAGDAVERAYSAEYELWLRSHFDDWSPANKADLARAATQPTTSPPKDIGERARKLIGSLVINHGMGCVASMLEGAEREAAAFLQSECTAAASQARRETRPLVDAALDWLNAGDALTTAKGDKRLPANRRLTEAHIALRRAAQEYRALATPQESAS